MERGREGGLTVRRHVLRVPRLRRRPPRLVDRLHKSLAVSEGSERDSRPICTGRGRDVRPICTGRGRDVSPICTGRGRNVRPICTGRGRDLRPIRTGGIRGTGGGEGGGHLQKSLAVALRREQLQLRLARARRLRVEPLLERPHLNAPVSQLGLQGIPRTHAPLELRPSVRIGDERVMGRGYGRGGRAAVGGGVGAGCHGRGGGGGRGGRQGASTG